MTPAAGSAAPVASSSLPLAISIVAILVSVATAYLSLRLKKKEEERTKRTMLTDTATKILAARMESLTRPTHLLEQINAQIIQLASLAVYLTTRIPHLVTDMDYVIIADAFGTTQDLGKARDFFQLAIKTSTVDSRQLTNRRSYAKFCFVYGDVGTGRVEYQKALDKVPPNDDLLRHAYGYTHRMWGISEFQAGYPNEALKHVDMAEEVFSNISNEIVRQKAVQELGELRAAVLQLRARQAARTGQSP